MIAEVRGGDKLSYMHACMHACMTLGGLLTLESEDVEHTCMGIWDCGVASYKSRLLDGIWCPGRARWSAIELDDAALHDKAIPRAAKDDVAVGQHIIKHPSIRRGGTCVVIQ